MIDFPAVMGWMSFIASSAQSFRRKKLLEHVGGLLKGRAEYALDQSKISAQTVRAETFTPNYVHFS